MVACRAVSPSRNPKHDAPTTHAQATAVETVRDALDQAYLAVFDDRGQYLHPLPSHGVTLIGRGEEAAIRLQDMMASRKHARVTVDGGRVEIEDLGSQNGTRVGGVRIGAQRLLVSGDVIEVGKAALVFHQTRHRVQSSHGLSFEAFRMWLEREVEQASAGDAAGVLAIRPEDGVGGVVWKRMLSGVTGRHAWSEETEGGAWIALAGGDCSSIGSDAAAVMESLKEAGVGVRAGLAVYPRDAADCDALLSAARSAALVAEPARLAGAEQAIRTIDVGGEVMLVADPAMLRVVLLIERLAVSDLALLVLGETGTGKELAARAVHTSSPRRSYPFVALNCAALTESIVESELFGHEKGAFTGAVARKIGIFEAARGGTVFLDEVGELPAATQAKLLRALDTHRITRVGDVVERVIDVRVVAATNRNLEAEVNAHRFRQDLYYRLAGGSLWLPPLRNRPRELLILARRFLEQACARLGRDPMELSPPACRMLAEHMWPGNVRELKNVMEYCAAAFPGGVLESWQIAGRLSDSSAQVPPDPGDPSGTADSLLRPLEEEVRELERSRIVEALQRSGGNQKQAAALLSVPLRTFINKLDRYGLRKVAK